MLMDLVMKEMRSRHAYLSEVYTPYFVCSYAMHVFNLVNQRKQVYWEGKRLPSMRLHIMFISPPGYMKSYYMTQIGDKEYGVLGGSKIKMGFKQSMTEAGLIGTIRVFNDVPYETEGVAQTYRDGILMVDEFSGITNAFKVTYNSQMDSQLLALLDHGRIYKDLAGGNIEYRSNMTLWGGVQPARYDFTSGMGRRMCFLLFLPTSVDNNNLMEIMMTTRNVRIDPNEMARIWREVDEWCDSMEDIESVTFDSGVIEFYKSLRLNSFEMPLFDRILLGYHLATRGADREVVVTCEDQFVRDMCTREKRWRDDIVRGIPFIQLKRIVAMCGTLHNGMYVITKKQVADEATMLGWNVQQVNELLQEMAKAEIIILKGSTVMMEVDKV